MYHGLAPVIYILQVSFYKIFFLRPKGSRVPLFECKYHLVRLLYWWNPRWNPAQGFHRVPLANAARFVLRERNCGTLWNPWTGFHQGFHTHKQLLPNVLWAKSGTLDSFRPKKTLVIIYYLTHTCIVIPTKGFCRRAKCRSLLLSRRQKSNPAIVSPCWTGIPPTSEWHPRSNHI